MNYTMNMNQTTTIEQVRCINRNLLFNFKVEKLKEQ